jgi:hypothetical protein
MVKDERGKFDVAQALDLSAIEFAPDIGKASLSGELLVRHFVRPSTGGEYRRGGVTARCRRHADRLRKSLSS